MRPKRARELRGWTRYQAGRAIGVGGESITYMEENPQRAREMKLSTAIRTIDAYWPDVNLASLMPGTRYRIVRIDE